MQKIVKRAGLKPWPKLFHNLRASRQTELTDSFPEHVVCDWIGNIQSVAREHYLRAKDEHFVQASGVLLISNGKHDGKQNCEQPGIAGNSLLLRIVQKVLDEQGLEQFAATVGKALQNYQAPPVGAKLMAKP